MSFDSNLSVRAPFLRAFTMSMYTIFGDFGSCSQKLLLRSVLAIFLASGHLPCMSEGSEVKGAAPKVEQRWEMLEPAPEMRARFPMCDKFLKVIWLDAAKEVGYAIFENVVNGVATEPKKASLIYIDLVYPRYDLDISDWWESGRLPQLTTIIKKSGIILQPDNANDIDFAVPGTSEGARLQHYRKLSLDRYRSNVCIPLPPNKYQGNNEHLDIDYKHFRKDFISSERPDAASEGERQWMWLAELKTPAGLVLSDEEIRKTYGDLVYPVDAPRHASADSEKITLAMARYCGIVDINRDGHPDCVNAQSLIYSHGNQYYKMKSTSDLSLNVGTSQYGTMRFPPSNRTCKIDDPLRQYLITDGERIYLNNTCELTDVAR